MGWDGMGWDGMVSTTSIDVVLERWAPLPPQLTSQGVVGFPALDSGLQNTLTLGDPGVVKPDTHVRATPPHESAACEAVGVHRCVPLSTFC